MADEELLTERKSCEECLRERENVDGQRLRERKTAATWDEVGVFTFLSTHFIPSRPFFLDFKCH